MNKNQPVATAAASKIEPLPHHISIIMDGNGRWAKARGLSRTQGHLEGVKRLQEIIETARRLGIKFLTFYAFSTENWNRPAEEVSMIMRTFISVLREKITALAEGGVRVSFIGRRESLPEKVVSAMVEAENKSINNKDLRLNVAFNYGSRAEIVDGLKSIISKIQEGIIKSDAIDEDLISNHLYTKGQPDPDLLIRTSGELRVSNFLLWQLSYAELYFTDTYWPDFTEKEFLLALANYAKRQRRWGAL